MSRLSVPRHVLSWVATILALLWQRTAWADDACRRVAEIERDRVKLPDGVAVGEAYFVGGESAPRVSLPTKDCDGGRCAALFFRVGAQPPSELPVGYTPLEKDAKWKKVNSDQCKPQLFWVVMMPPSQAAQPTRPTPATPTTAPAPPAPAPSTTKSDTTKENKGVEALKNFRERRSNASTESASVGTGQAGPGVIAAETLQILGQIVVDRASEKAYDLIKRKLMDFLDCPKEQDPEGSQLQSRLEAGCSPPFAATCNALSTLRIQDIASAPTALGFPLVDDLLRMAGERWDGANSFDIISPLMASVVAPLASRPDLMAPAATPAIVDTLQDFVMTLPAFEKMTPAQKSVAMGITAFVECSGKKTEPPCDIGAKIDAFGPEVHASRAAARALAMQLVALSGASARSERQRARLAVATAFATACMLEKSSDAPELACPDIATLAEVNSMRSRIAFAAAFADASLAPDYPRLVVVGGKFLALHFGAAEGEGKRRAMRLIGGILDYAATYQTPTDAKDQAAAAKAHDQRTKVLESLTKDMTDRTGRQGDTVVSLGGALRFFGGYRFGLQTNENVLHGPMSLPLGIAITHIPSRPGRVGFHMQIDAFDLGNYLAFENSTPKVKTPEVGDAFAPGLTIGIACGASLPLVIGGSVSYSPQFAPEASRPTDRGTLNVGATLGVHVPLLDLN